MKGPFPVALAWIETGAAYPAAYWSATVSTGPPAPASPRESAALTVTAGFAGTPTSSARSVKPARWNWKT